MNDHSNPDHGLLDQAARRYQSGSKAASWVFGAVLIAFLMYSFFLPNLSSTQCGLLRFFIALTAGFFFLFFVGGIVLEGQLKGLGVGAGGGVALFFLIQFVANPVPGCGATTNVQRPDLRGHPTFKILSSAGEPLVLNFSQQNTGNEEATKVMWYSVLQVFDGNGDRQEFLSALEEKLRDKVSEGDGDSSKPVPPLAVFSATTKGPTLAQEQFKRIKTGESSVYVMSVVLYSGHGHNPQGDNYTALYCGRSEELSSFVGCAFPNPW